MHDAEERAALVARLVGSMQTVRELARDGVQLVRLDCIEETVHDCAPGPEAVVAGAGFFGQSGHGALMSV